MIAHDTPPPKGCALAAVSTDVTVYVLLDGVVDLKAEAARLGKV